MSPNQTRGDSPATDRTNADPEAARAFWAEHALLNGRSLEHELAEELTAHMREEEE